MDKLEERLNQEIQKRVGANKSLQSLFEHQIQSIQERLESVFIDKLEERLNQE